MLVTSEADWPLGLGAKAEGLTAVEILFALIDLASMIKRPAV